MLMIQLSIEQQSFYLTPEFLLTNVMGEFKHELLSKIKTDKKSVFDIHNMRDKRYLTKIRILFNPLNKH